ncbi:MAG TPA: ribosome-associated translation inhibitor RaiA [Actinobacteria bacterium]|nr:ribosome-associated translation inhibitor RaiA [Actinomycetota bacterium]
MEFIVKGHNMEMTDALRKYAEDKIMKITRHFNRIMKIEVEFDVQKNPSVHNSQTVETTLFTKGPVIKASVSSEDMYASIDQVVDKLERQIEKYKGKIYRSNSRQGSLDNVVLEQKAEGHREQVKAQIVKTKQFSMKPMSPEEAILQMDLLGHDFYVFTNSTTEETNVVYRRKDDNYGLIGPSYNLEE